MSEENPEVKLDQASYQLFVIQRELKYHQSVYEAANAGFDDCFDFLNAAEGEPDAEESSHVSMWAQRLQMASQAVSEVADQTSRAAQLVSELTRGAPAGKELI
jgi:hypothetical protein